jgi:RecA/RadA recombinase
MNIIDELEKNFGNLNIPKNKNLNIPLLVDILGIKGLPKKSFIELYGKENSGKSTLIYNIIKEAQKKDYICCLFDLDRNFDDTYAGKYVNIKNLLYINLKIGKLTTVIYLIKKLQPICRLFFIDSIAQIHYQELHKNLELLKSTISKTKSVVVYANQIRTFKKVKSFGTKRLKYYTDIRLKLNKIKDNIINLDVMKNIYSMKRGNFNLEVK